MKHKDLLIAVTFIFIFIAACKKSSTIPKTGKNLVLSPIELQKVAADNAFTLKLFKNLDSANINKTNLLVSPLSVSFALGMTSNGSNGQTLSSIWNAMNFTGFTQDQVNSYYNKLNTNLP